MFRTYDFPISQPPLPMTIDQSITSLSVSLACQPEQRHVEIGRECTDPCHDTDVIMFTIKTKDLQSVTVGA